ncbi:MAG: FAD-dependent oxidoreductase [Gammaproteobacteria bacterium]|nr:FAD-dependent oxidoreductase [Gammaproteobacteria bacterium]
MNTQFPQPHTGSYYAATANSKEEYPVLEGAEDCDVCIVGGGFTGISSALELTERGYKVVVVEANRVSWGASGRNGGQLIGGISGESKLHKAQGKDMSDLFWDMHWAGNEIVKSRVEKYKIDCDLKSGYIDVATRPRHIRELEEYCEELQKKQFPFETRMVTKEACVNELGTDHYLGGMVNMANGHLHPLNLCQGEATAAVEQGAKIFEQSPVIRIEHGNRPKVFTDKGYVESNFVILAGNAYHMLEKRYTGGVVFPAGSYIIATEPLSEELQKEIVPADMAVCEMNHVLNYYRLSADKRMLFGGRCNYSGRDPASIKDSMLPRMLEIYPQLKGLKIDYEWGGKIGIVINRVPHLGQISNNIYFAQGYSGHGVNVTHLVGQILADAISGTSERFDIFAKVKHHRIPGGRVVGNNLVALGMLYFRMLDLLP